MSKILKPGFKRGFAPILIIGVVAVVVFFAFVIFGPYELPGLGQLSLRQQAQKSQAAEGDEDGDGFSDAIENYLGTDPKKACPQTPVAGDEEIDSWPPDFNDDRTVDITDTATISGHFSEKIQEATPEATSEAPQAVADFLIRRFDLNLDGFVDISDITQVSGFFGQTCKVTQVPEVTLPTTVPATPSATPQATQPLVIPTPPALQPSKPPSTFTTPSFPLASPFSLKFASPSPTVSRRGGTTTVCKKRGDVNKDCLINASDLSALLSGFGKGGTGSDLNGDGKVDIVDLSILFSNWGK